MTHSIHSFLRALLRAVLLGFLLGGAFVGQAQDFLINEFETISYERISRSEMRVVLKAMLMNHTGAAATLTARATSTVGTTALVNDTLRFQNVPAHGSALSAGTLTLTQDRSVAFRPEDLAWVFTPDPEAGPTVEIERPTAGLFTAQTTIEVQGTVGETARSVKVNGGDAVLTERRFNATVPVREGNNTITAVALDEAGRAGTATVQVTRDTERPRVVIDSPRDQAVLTTSAATVTGSIHDIVAGTVNLEQCRVVVNGVAAQIANRSYLATGVPLTLGANVITAVGTDNAGNIASATVAVTRREATGPQIMIVSGDHQSGPIASQLPQPLVVKVTDETGAPLAGKDVIFKVCQNDGTVTGDGRTARSVVVATDGEGKASVVFTLGTRFGVGNHQVEALVVGYENEVVFCASAQAGPAALIVSDNGNRQEGVVGQPLPRPLVAVVIDTGNNRLPGVPVTFTVTQGGGNLNGQMSRTVASNGDGMVALVLTLGPEPGIENNAVEATFPGNSGVPVVWTATGVEAGEPAQTSVSGVVLDNSNDPIEGVTLNIIGTELRTRSNAQGQFQLQPAPVGSLKLFVDGSTANRPGTWPHLEFDMVTIAGRDNTVGMPIFLLPIDLANGLFVDESHGGKLTLDHLPGFSLEVAPGSATFPDDSRSGIVSVTLVHNDKVPMVPNFGQQPRFVVTIQPAGVHFVPPARLCLPNVDALPPGQKTEMYSFDHDLGMFVAIGTGTVPDDGLQVCSDPGVGVIKGGWHCGGNPAAVAQGLATSVSVKPLPIVVCKDEETTLTAEGKPQPPYVDKPYRWTAGSNVTITDPEGDGTATIKGKTAGNEKSTVRYLCKSAQPADADFEVTVVEVEKLLEVNFGGAVTDLVKNDGSAYPTPHYQDGRTTQSPVSYVRKAKPQATAKFKVLPASYTGKLKITGEGPDGIIFPEKEVSVSGGTAEYPMTAASAAFKDAIGIYDKFVITWEVGVKDTKCFEFKSENQVYVTLGAPSGAKFHTLFHLGCLNAQGKTTPDDAVTEMYKEFGDQNVQRVDPTTGQLDGVAMTYWSTTNPAPQPQCWTTAGLLDLGDGRCGAWAAFMVDLLKIQGIASDVAVVDAPAVQDPVKLNADVMAKLPAGTYSITAIFYVDDWDLSDPDPFKPKDKPGAAGQGNPDPRADFCNHAIVKYSGKYYDPSYGSPVRATKVAWEDPALDGFGAYVHDAMSLYRWVERTDPKGVLDATINP